MPEEELEALPKDAKPVVRWSNRDSAWLNVIEGIRRALSRYELANTPSDHEIAQTEPRTVQRYFITLPSEPSTHHVVPPSPLARRPVQRHRRVLPFYLVCDESASMAGMPIDAINNALLELHREIGSNPVVADKTRFCLIGFSDNADVLMPLSDLSTVTQLPKLAAGGGTNYEAVFETLRTTIENDVAALERADNIIYRPAVFFLSNGYTRRDDWHDAFQALTDANWRPRPNILAFGFGDADEYVIGQVATVRAFAGNGAIGPADALREFANSLIRSIVNSVTPSPSNPDGGANLSMPDNVPGFTNISAPQI